MRPRRDAGSLVTSPEAGRVHALGWLPGRLVQAGQDLVVIERV
jgi:biotin carboxyl carrier protein